MDAGGGDNSISGIFVDASGSTITVTAQNPADAATVRAAAVIGLGNLSFTRNSTIRVLRNEDFTNIVNVPVIVGPGANTNATLSVNAVSGNRFTITHPNLGGGGGFNAPSVIGTSGGPYTRANNEAFAACLLYTSPSPRD